MSAKRYMIHHGTGRVTRAAVTHTEFNPETGEAKVIEDSPEEAIEIPLSPGSKFGDFPINVPVHVRTEEQAKDLEAKGFVDYDAATVKTGAKGAAAAPLQEIQDNGLSGKLAEIAERDRKRAVERAKKLPAGKRGDAPTGAAKPVTAPQKAEPKPETIGAEPGKAVE